MNLFNKRLVWTRNQHIINVYKVFQSKRMNYAYTTSNLPISEQTIEQKFQLPRVHARKRTNIWKEYAALAAKYKPINLGLGFPDSAVPSHIRSALIEVADSEDPLLHQYTRGFGHPRLVKILAEFYAKKFDRLIDPYDEILVTVGAHHALYCAIVGLVDAEDEVIIIEPFFECYESIVQSVGGKPVYIPLRKQAACNDNDTAANYSLNTEELTNLFNARTKLIIVNNPQNPIGKVYTQEELTIIGNLCKKWNVVCISDEVYDFTVFEPYTLCTIATLPGMWERTITIGSAGKLLSITGWNMGYAFGPPVLINNLQVIHTNTILFYNTPMQEALAIILEKEMKKYGFHESHFFTFNIELEKKKAFLVHCLQDVGMTVIVPQAGYFTVADYTTLKHNVDLSCKKNEWKDIRFTKWMTKKIGLQAIPVSAFYAEHHKQLFQNFVRFCHFKKEETMLSAQKLLREWKIKEES